MKKIFLIMLGLNVLIFANFNRNNTTGIVTDTNNNLEWQDNTVAGTMDWSSAITYCGNLSLDGNGWRLPNINELKSIMNYDKESPTVKNIFINTSEDEHWSYYLSSTTAVFAKSTAWYVNFSSGNMGEMNKDMNKSYIRCVRNNKK
ncbi:MAG: DUF1566 domain-containing protein [Epsilonproteobacteria bacterium]|nr:DUF1566 domain-containing protein [Campylobacterota bacterium]